MSTLKIREREIYIEREGVIVHINKSDIYVADTMYL